MEFLSRSRFLMLGSSARSMKERRLLEILRNHSLDRGTEVVKSKASRSLLPEACQKAQRTVRKLWRAY